MIDTRTGTLQSTKPNFLTQEEVNLQTSRNRCYFSVSEWCSFPEDEKPVI